MKTNFFKVLVASLPAFLLAGCSTIGFGGDDDRSVDRGAIEDALIERFGREGEIDYAMVSYDLDDDGRDEAIVHIRSNYYCGSGGCNALVLTPDFNGYRIVMDATVTRTPIAVLDSETRGWSDLVVAYGGGGRDYGRALMRFDGLSYPGNPTVAPAERTSRRGDVLISEDPDYRELVD
ncbi:hypothetical protein [Aurantiacibacter aquimixticola]|uniref:Lipoprotein n=1 Tax=Aurantiacibacter aquimixticola TaxID=1958945 RepID=A0A419RQI1_9SPHN|nr:hypothetical protein [Aurantiacibacter aquimixticola]RJY08053.1 hypothetical protein D6201_00585 [Aurantiacibacter aquimixticola]